jgi:hypothetical protein
MGLAGSAILEWRRYYIVISLFLITINTWIVINQKYCWKSPDIVDKTKKKSML